MDVGEEGDYMPIATLSPQNDSCIKMDSNEGHFKVSIGSVRQSHKTMSTIQKPVFTSASFNSRTRKIFLAQWLEPRTQR